MPRNGDGSGDSGPYEDHEIVHGNRGDDTLQRTKHVADMPDTEGGEALPGMNASGGAGIPLKDSSAEYGATAPRYERRGDDEYSTMTGDARSTGANNSGRSNNSYNSGSYNRSSGRDDGTSGSYNRSSDRDNGSSSSYNRSSERDGSTPGNYNRSSDRDNGSSDSYNRSSDRDNGSAGNYNRSSDYDNDLEQISREKAERFVNLDEEDVDHASSRKDYASGAERSSNRAPRDVGSKEDIEQIHGKAQYYSGSDRGADKDTREYRSDSGHQGHGYQSEETSHRRHQKSGDDEEGQANPYEQEVRHKAERFVPLDE